MNISPLRSSNGKVLASRSSNLVKSHTFTHLLWSNDYWIDRKEKKMIRQINQLLKYSLAAALNDTTTTTATTCATTTTTTTTASVQSITFNQILRHHQTRDHLKKKHLYYCHYNVCHL